MLIKIKFIQLFQLSILGLGFLASNTSAREACIDKHALKTQCIEWAWFGEWYVDISVRFLRFLGYLNSCPLCRTVLIDFAGEIFARINVKERIFDVIFVEKIGNHMMKNHLRCIIDD